MVDAKSGFEVVDKPYWPMEDIWPPGTITQESVDAYKLLNDRGQIHVQKIVYNKQTGVVRVIYESLGQTDAERGALCVDYKAGRRRVDE